jgi:hypothetical protein
MRGCNNLENEGLRNRRDTPGLRAMVELKRSVRKGASAGVPGGLLLKASGDPELQVSARMHR